MDVKPEAFLGACTDFHTYLPAFGIVRLQSINQSMLTKFQALLPGCSCDDVRRACPAAFKRFDSVEVGGVHIYVNYSSSTAGEHMLLKFDIVTIYYCCTVVPWSRPAGL